jgi:hypothetical protein
MKKISTLPTLNINLTDDRFGIIYISNNTLKMFGDDCSHVEFIGTADSPIWFVIAHNEDPQSESQMVFRKGKSLKGKRVVGKMFDFMDFENDINKFSLEKCDFNGMACYSFDVSKNLNVNLEVVKIIGAYYNPFDLKYEVKKTPTYSEYAPVPLSRGYHVEV